MTIMLVVNEKINQDQSGFNPDVSGLEFCPARQSNIKLFNILDASVLTIILVVKEKVNEDLFRFQPRQIRVGILPSTSEADSYL